MDWSRHYVSNTIDTTTFSANKSFAISDADWRFAYLLLAIIIPRIVNGFFCFPDNDKIHTAGMTAQLRIPTFPWHQKQLKFL